MKIPVQLFQEYIDRYPGLGFTKVSQFALYIIQQKTIEIKKEFES